MIDVFVSPVSVVRSLGFIRRRKKKKETEKERNIVFYSMDCVYFIGKAYKYTFILFLRVISISTKISLLMSSARTNIIFVFRLIVVSIWIFFKSSILSIKTMTKGSSRFSKLCSTASSNCIEQKILIEPETQIIIVEDEHTQTIQQSTDNNCLQRSDNLVTKLFKSTLKSKFFNQKNKKLENSEDSASEEEMLPNHLSSVNSTALAVAIPIEEPQADLKSTLNDGFKLKVYLTL